MAQLIVRILFQETPQSTLLLSGEGKSRQKNEEHDGFQLQQGHQELCSMAAMQHPGWSLVKNDLIGFSLAEKRREF